MKVKRIENVLDGTVDMVWNVPEHLQLRAQQILSEIKCHTRADQYRELILIRTAEHNMDRAITRALSLAARGELAHIDLIRLPAGSNGHPSAPCIGQTETDPDPQRAARKDNSK